jgi:hypothetical protein
MVRRFGNSVNGKIAANNAKGSISEINSVVFEFPPYEISRKFTD